MLPLKLICALLLQTHLVVLQSPPEPFDFSTNTTRFDFPITLNYSKPDQAADCGGQDFNDALLEYLKAFREAFTDDKKPLRESANAMSQAKERAIEVVNTSMADVKHSDDLATAYGNDFLIMGGWKMAKEKPKDPEASFLSPVIPFPTFLDSFFSGYAQNFKEYISNATKDSTKVTDADLKKMDFFVRLAWRANTELGYSCQTQYKDEYWKFVLVMLVNDESGKPHPANDTVGTYKSNVKQFWT